MRENRFIVLVFSVVPSLAPLAPERQSLTVKNTIEILSFLTNRVKCTILY